jgi:large subunit ribosomal protein L24
MAQLKLKIKKGDRVVVIAGRDKGKHGEVLQVIPAENRALVQGINIVRRHQQQSPQQDGGIVAKEAPIHISNIAIEDPADGSPSRVGFKFTDDGRKVRFAKRSGETIDG